MFENLKIFIVGLVSFIILDYFWLEVLAGSFYKNLLNQFSEGIFKPNLWVALLVYVIGVIGIQVFVLPKAFTLLQALLWGVLFGLILYGVYEGTNLAILNGWPLKMAIVDILWGGVVIALTSTLMFWASSF